MSIADHVVINITVGGGSPPAAGFGVPLFVALTAVGSPDRLLGPFTSAQDLIDFGFASSDESVLWANKLLSQRPRPSSFMIGRQDAADLVLADALPLINAEGPGDYFGVNAESRDPDDIMAIATFFEPLLKIAITQTNDAATLADTTQVGQLSTITVGGTPTDGAPGYGIKVVDKWTGAVLTDSTLVRAGTPATNADLAAALELEIGTDLDAVATLGSSGDDVTIDFTDTGHGYLVILTAPAPGTLVEVITNLVQNVGESLEEGSFNNTGLFYHALDADYNDGAWTGRGLGFDLDSQKGFWQYKQLNGVTGDSLSSTEKSNLRSNNVNYYAPLTMTSGTAVDPFTFEGKVSSGRQIDQTTSIHWLQARMEEALLGVFLRSPLGVGFDDVGFGQLEAGAQEILALGLSAGHFVERVSEASGRQTPFIDTVPLAEVSTADDSTKTVRMSGEVHIRTGALRVVFNITANLEG